MSEKAMKPLISVVFSFRNEEQSIPELVRRCRLVMGSLCKEEKIRGYELIFVNDDSVDHSKAILLELADGSDDIRIVNMSRNFGVSPCVMAGLAYSKGDAVIYMDADLQDPPELIAQMVDAWRGGDRVDVVHTVRRTRHGEPWLKLFITRIGYAILNRYCTVKIPREAGDFKLLSRRVVNHLLTLREQRPFIRGLVCWVGFKQVFLPYDRCARFAGSSKFFVLSRKVISNFFNSAIVNFSAVPLQLASYIGLAVIFLDIAFLGYIVVGQLSGRSSGWSPLMGALLFIGGVQLFCLGMIGLYVNAIYEQSKMRPKYIVDSTFGFPDDEKHA